MQAAPAAMEYGMKRHKWRRRLGVLCLLILICVAVLKVLASGNEDKNREETSGEETIVGWMIDKVTCGEVELSDEDSIRQAIVEGEAEFGLSLSNENKDRIVGFMRTLDAVEVGAEDFIEQAKQMYQKYSTELVEEANLAINEAVEGAVESAVESAVENLMEDIKRSVVNFFKNLIPS